MASCCGQARKMSTSPAGVQVRAPITLPPAIGSPGSWRSELVEQALGAEVSQSGVEVFEIALRARPLAAIKKQRDLELSRLSRSEVL